MLAILYLAVACVLGWQLSGFLLKPEADLEGNRVWVRCAAAFGVGTLVMTWVLYFLAWFFHMVLGMKVPLILGNILVILGAAVLSFVLIWRKRKKGGEKEVLIRNQKLLVKEIILYELLLVFISFTMHYVFFYSDGKLFSGYSVFSDYAPHTAMIRSFSLSANYPTQYPHFGGEDVKYHFMFQFLTGNLEFLGLRIDLAYNVVSILSLLGFLVVLTQLARRLTKSFAASAVASALFFFRSGLAFFLFIKEHVAADDLFTTLQQRREFIGYTPNENWGLWNYNVYLNQRHLGFGLLIAALVIWLFMEYLMESGLSEMKGVAWLRFVFAEKEAWLPKAAVTAALAGVVLGLVSFWNGAAVIGALVILAGMALFSRHKLDYAIMAAVAMVFSFLQTKIFIRGSSFALSFRWGFIAEDKSFLGVLWYILEVMGVTGLGCLILVFFLKREKRLLLFAFVLPVIFAFTISLTPDVTVNHKYIMIAMAFLSILWGYALVVLFRRRWTAVIGVVLAICLMATGFYDFVIVIRDNGRNRSMAIDLESSLTKWLADNTTEKDLILTPYYSMSEVTLSGCMMYMGWPYYPWSAGYDTNYRGQKAKEMYTTYDTENLRQLVEEEGIDYIIFENGLDLDGEPGHEETIAEAYQLVYTSDNGMQRIYKTT